MSLGSVDLLGVTIPIPIVSNSGLQLCSVRHRDARLVNAETGQVIKTVYTPEGEGRSWKAFDDTTKTYDFHGASFSDIQ